MIFVNQKKALQLQEVLTKTFYLNIYTNLARIQNIYKLDKWVNRNKMLMNDQITRKSAHCQSVTNDLEKMLLTCEDKIFKLL